MGNHREKITPLAKAFRWAIICLSLSAGMLILLECTRKVYVPVESVSADTTIVDIATNMAHIQSMVCSLCQSANKRERIVVRDSIVTIIDSSGAVVSREAYHDSDRNAEVETMLAKIEARYDSVYESQNSELIRIREMLSEVLVPAKNEPTFMERIFRALREVVPWIIVGVVAGYGIARKRL